MHVHGVLMVRLVQLLSISSKAVIILHYTPEPASATWHCRFEHIPICRMGRLFRQGSTPDTAWSVEADRNIPTSLLQPCLWPALLKDHSSHTLTGGASPCAAAADSLQSPILNHKDILITPQQAGSA